MDRIFDTPWYSLEQAVYEPLGRSRDVGVCFDVVRAEALVLEMTQAMATAAREIQRVLPPIEVEEWFTPKRDNAKKGYRKGEPFRKVKKAPLNPNSSVQLAARAEALGWPVHLQLTDTGSQKCMTA